MTKAAVFTMKLEAELRAEFLAAAEASHRPASQVVRELMRGYVHQQREDRERAAFLQGKVDAARVSVAGDRGRDDAAVEHEFAALRARASDRA